MSSASLLNELFANINIFVRFQFYLLNNFKVMFKF